MVFSKKKIKNEQIGSTVTDLPVLLLVHPTGFEPTAFRVGV